MPVPKALASGDPVWVLSCGAYAAGYTTVGFNGFAPLRTRARAGRRGPAPMGETVRVRPSPTGTGTPSWRWRATPTPASACRRAVPRCSPGRRRRRRPASWWTSAPHGRLRAGAALSLPPLPRTWPGRRTPRPRPGPATSICTTSSWHPACAAGAWPGRCCGTSPVPPGRAGTNGSPGRRRRHGTVLVGTRLHPAPRGRDRRRLRHGRRLHVQAGPVLAPSPPARK